MKPNSLPPAVVSSQTSARAGTTSRKKATVASRPCSTGSQGMAALREARKRSAMAGASAGSARRSWELWLASALMIRRRDGRDRSGQLDDVGVLVAVGLAAVGGVDLDVEQGPAGRSRREHAVPREGEGVARRDREAQRAIDGGHHRAGRREAV